MRREFKIFYERPKHMRHDFEDEFAHLAWGADAGLGGISTVVVPPNTGALEQQANSYKGTHTREGLPLRQRAPDRGCCSAMGSRSLIGLYAVEYPWVRVWGEVSASVD